MQTRVTPADPEKRASYRIREVPPDAAVRAMAAGRDQLVVSPFVLAELDYLIATRRDVLTAVILLRELAGGAWELAALDGDDVRRSASIIERYHDQAIGLADASNVVLAQRYGTRRIATLDRRHFEVLRPLQGGRFTLVP
jgi:uncharacterized protein